KNEMVRFGLIGKNIGYSFSKEYFNEKFKKMRKKYSYENFDIAHVNQINEILENNKKLKGLNVTVPYKESVIPFLDDLDKESSAIGAVNTIKIDKKKRMIGYNTDHYGFAMAISDYLPVKNKKAIVLGSGGSSKAVQFVLKMMSFDTLVVSRKKSKSTITYDRLDEKIISSHHLIVNCTPLGTFPNIHEYPHIPYKYIGKNHLLFDLTYNPQISGFMEIGMIQGAKVSNGYNMLIFQAEKSWKIWNSK
ncbi:MAG: shikimate dehydrogenase family protein, partial [Candidatus Nitrosomaritimum aestuariumsis]